MTTKIYLTNLSAYNNGVLLGKWLEMPFTAEEWDEAYKSIGSPEEYFITDFDADFDIDEFEDINALNEFCEAIEELDEDKVTAMFEAGYTKEQILECEDDVIFYSDMTLEDVAYDLVEECYNLPEFVERYFDYEAFARDLSFVGYTETTCGVIYIPS